MTGKLTGFEHEISTMTVTRRDEELREGKNICTPSIFKNPAREKIWGFLKPALLQVRRFYPQMLKDAR